MGQLLRNLWLTSPRVERLEHSKDDTSSKAPVTDNPKERFAEYLKEILERPDPLGFVCRCCEKNNQLMKCEALTAQCLFSGLELRRYRCPGCRVVFGPMPLVTCSTAELSRLYELVYRFYREGFSQPFQEKTFYLLNPSRKGRYLNYACGDWADGLAHLRTLGWQVWGYEPFQPVCSEWIAKSLTDWVGQPFDGLVTHNYIEHVQDPARFFQQCCELLTPRGRMAHSSPCYDYLYEVSPFHLYFYCQESIVKLASRFGLHKTAEFRSDSQIPGEQYTCCIFERVDSGAVA